jgi:hypothetical protein
MSQWVRTLDIKTEWDQVADDKLSINELASIIAKKLNRFGLVDDVELQGIIDDMEMLGEDATIEDFNCIMENLYDWADTPLDNEFGGKRNCWVKTF